MTETVETGVVKSLPTIREWPLVGSAPVIQRDFLRFLTGITGQCAEAGQFHLGPFQGVVFNTNQTAQAVLV